MTRRNARKGPGRWATHDEARKAGWYSRRNQERKHSRRENQTRKEQA